jgi:hypothetical protein
VQVDPIKPTLKAPGTKLLKLKYVGSLSNFAFNFNLCRCTKAVAHVTRDYLSLGIKAAPQTLGRGFPSSIFLLNLSAFCGVGGACRGGLGGVRGY